MRFGRRHTSCAPTLRAGDPWACHGTLARGAAALAVEQDDLQATLYALRCLVGLASHGSGETPRSILVSELIHAPSDEMWSATALGDRA